jgi:hypothetical protein
MAANRKWERTVILVVGGEKCEVQDQVAITRGTLARSPVLTGNGLGCW